MRGLKKISFVLRTLSAPTNFFEKKFDKKLLNMRTQLQRLFNLRTQLYQVKEENMDRKAEIEKEYQNLRQIFSILEQNEFNLISGLLEETAYQKVTLCEMREIMSETGMILIHPHDNTKQKALPIANEYRRTANIYALNIKQLYSLLHKLDDEQQDAFDEWLKESDNYA